MKIGIYGGSFNPVHRDHETIVNSVLEQKLVDEVWLVPCKNHAFEKELISPEHRINMLNLVFEEYVNVKIDYTELESDAKSYTAQTIKTLKKQYDYDFHFIAGTDVLNELNRWRDSDYLKNNLNFIAVQRQGHPLIIDNLNLDAIIDPPLSISSTDIRKRINERKSISHLVNPKVEKYIQEKKLYLKEEFRNPAATVDLIVPFNEGLILIKRKHEPYKGFWALPGGYLDYGKETLEEAGVRELQEETSLITTPDMLNLIGVYSNPSRDPRGHVISHAYEVSYFTGEPKAGDDAAKICVFKNIPKKLAFDHSKIINDYHQKKRQEE
ncbi:MAG: nicotinate (nicotinamide) nucleotide adenylyltransferase [Candidatus Nanoarchaeia archaeon]